MAWAHDRTIEDTCSRSTKARRWHSICDVLCSLHGCVVALVETPPCASTVAVLDKPYRLSATSVNLLIVGECDY